MQQAVLFSLCFNQGSESCSFFSLCSDQCLTCKIQQAWFQSKELISLFIKNQELNIGYIGEIFGKEKFPFVTSVQNQQGLLLEKDVSILPQFGGGEIQTQGTWEGYYPNTLCSKIGKTTKNPPFLKDKRLRS